MTRVEIHKQLCDSTNQLYAAKNADYGDSYSKLRAKYPESICIRIEDKLSRLEQLMKPGYNAKISDESKEDTLIDLANYCLMEVTEMRYESQDKNDGTTPLVVDNWVPIWALSEDGKTEYFNQDIVSSDAEIWYNEDLKYYELSVELAYEFMTTKSLEDWLDNVEAMLFRFVNLREPETTYELTWQDGFKTSDCICGKTMRECAEKFSFYADNIIRHFKEKEKYGL